MWSRNRPELSPGCPSGQCRSLPGSLLCWTVVGLNRNELRAPALPRGVPGSQEGQASESRTPTRSTICTGAALQASGGCQGEAYGHRFSLQGAGASLAALFLKTSRGNSHTTGAGGCDVTGSAPRPWPQSGPPTSRPREAHPEGSTGDEGAAPDKVPPDSTRALRSRQAWPSLPGSEGRPRGQWWPRLSLLSGGGMASEPRQSRRTLLPPQKTPRLF